MAKRQKNQQPSPTVANEQLSLPYDRHITLSELEAHLWESANILRGPVDAADFKTYIFPLLFFKRICDVYNEEFQTALEESGGDQVYAGFPEIHCFQIPEGYHWRDIREKTSQVGQALQQALQEIEKANQRTLYGIFGDAQWSNKERLSEKHGSVKTLVLQPTDETRRERF